MPPITRIGDVTVGVCDHGLPCCPHGCVGVHITSSPDVTANGRKITRRGDLSAHSCPHCGVNANVGHSPNVQANSIPVTRKGDAVTEFCGGGVCVSGSPDVIVN